MINNIVKTIYILEKKLINCIIKLYKNNYNKIHQFSLQRFYRVL